MRRFWQGMGCALVALAGLAVLIGGVGLFLPSDHNVTETMVVQAPPARIAALIRAVEDEPRWRAQVAAVRVFSRTGPTTHFAEIDRRGRARAIEQREAEPGRWFERVIGDERSATYARWTIVLDPVPEGTRVAIDERGAARWPLLRMAAAWLRGPDAAIRDYLRDLSGAAGISSAARPANAAAR